MTSERVAVLDGTAGSKAEQARVAATLLEVLGRTSGVVETFTLRDERIAHCIGCFGCWLETPGLCRTADRGRDVVRAMVHADTVVLLTPVTFGGYSSVLKRVVDRWIQVLLPFFETYHGELHHPLRYGRFPRLVAVGIQPAADEAEATVFRTLVARNALNFRAPSHAVEVVTAGMTADELAARLTRALLRHEAVPAGAPLPALEPAPPAAPFPERLPEGRTALVLVGSPKTKKPSTSGVLGRHFLALLEARGWRGEVLTVTAAIRDASWRERMLASVEASDLLVLAFPLYIDAIPALLTAAMEAIREHRRSRATDHPQRLAVLVNSGFPEARHSLPALAICARFAHATGMAWAGGLAMGAGEALSSGAPLAGPRPAGPRPPVGHVIAALDLTATELARGWPVPPEAMALIARAPIPFLPFATWRRLFAFMGGRHWREEAARNGVGRRELLARPFIVEESAGAAPAP
jgi:multimeric flavodoxin WrbA